MGLLDEAIGSLSNSASGGSNNASPLINALGTLLVHTMFNGNTAPSMQNTAPSLQPSATPESNSAATPDGGLLGGLGGLLNQLQAAGHGDKVNSWVGPGQNQPIDPGHLGAALGQQNVSTAAQQAGMSEQQLLSELAQKLPGFIEKLTANGRMPTLQDVAAALTQAQAQR